MKAKYILKCVGAGILIGILTGILAASITIIFVKTSDIYLLYFFYPLILGSVGLITGFISSLITQKWNKILITITVVISLLFVIYLLFFMWAFNI